MWPSVPLLIYANGAKLLRLSTIGILQYIAPTMIFRRVSFVRFLVLSLWTLFSVSAICWSMVRGIRVARSCSGCYGESTLSAHLYIAKAMCEVSTG